MGEINVGVFSLHLQVLCLMMTQGLGPPLPEMQNFLFFPLFFLSFSLHTCSGSYGELNQTRLMEGT